MFYEGRRSWRSVRKELVEYQLPYLLPRNQQDILSTASSARCHLVRLDEESEYYVLSPMSHCCRLQREEGRKPRAALDHLY